MSMTVTRRKDNKTPRVFMHKVADIRGGVSIKVSELGGDYLKEGAVLSAPDKDGICHVVKIADLYAALGASEKTVKVAKFHNFKVGDVVMADEGGKASAITAIDTTAKEYDTLTISAAIGAVDKGGQIIEAKAATTGSDSALKYTPLAVSGTGKPFEQNSNLDTDAWLIGVTKGNPLPACVSKHLKGIINY